MNGRGHVSSPSVVLILAAVLMGIDCGWVNCTWAAARSAQAVADSPSVYAGEPFHFQIRIPEARQPEAPDVACLTNFIVEPRGGQTYRQESFNSINGRTTRVADWGYAYDYQLTPRRDGGVDEETIQGLRELFWRCEACRYGGCATGLDSQTLLNRCYELAGHPDRMTFGLHSPGELNCQLTGLVR